MGNSLQGTVLPGQVQAVKEGNGITILSDGTIEVDSQTIRGVMRLGQTQAYADSAYNKYWWPVGVTGADVGKQLTVTSIDGSGNAYIEWKDSDGIDWTARGQIIAAIGAGETNDTLVNIGSARSFLMSAVDNVGNPSGLAYSDVITSAMKVPAGDETQKPGTPVSGEFRFNTTQDKLEVWDGFEWQTIASENPLDGSFVRQIASTVPGETDVAVIPVGTTGERITAPTPQEGWLRFNSDPSTDYGTDGTMEFWDGSSWITVAAIPAPAGFVPQTSSIGAAVVPAGQTTDRPASPLGGYFRYNTDQNFLEFYNSATTTWELIAPAGGGVTSFVQSATPTAFNEGDLWYDTVRQRESVWNGVAWVQPGVSQTGPLGAAQLPAGTSPGDRPAAVAGMLRYSTTTGFLEYYDSVNWVSVGGGVPDLGLDLNATNSLIKTKVPEDTAPLAAGTGAGQAIVGSTYYDINLGSTFVYYSNGTTPVWVMI